MIEFGREEMLTRAWLETGAARYLAKSIPTDILVTEMTKRESARLVSEDTQRVLDVVDEQFPANRILVMNCSRQHRAARTRSIAGWMMVEVLEWDTSEAALALNISAPAMAAAINQVRSRARREPDFRAKVELVREGLV